MTTINKATNARFVTVGQKVLVFFAANHEEEATIADLSVKFQTNQRTVASSMAALRDSGLLSAHRQDGAEWRKHIYTAGPELLRLLGRGQHEVR